MGTTAAVTTNTGVGGNDVTPIARVGSRDVLLKRMKSIYS
jgi:hypothetical protein